MKIKFVADSSANINTLEGLDVAYAPLKIIAGEKEYVDTADLDVAQMIAELKEYKGKSGTACPSIKDWETAFDNADIVYAVAITSGLSGSYNSGLIAADDYMQTHPDAKVFVFDSLSAGPGMQLYLEKMYELVQAGKSYDEVCQAVEEYRQHNRLVFTLASVDNFAKNGRINPLLAKAIGVLGIRIIARASEEGTIEPIHKCRGEKKALQTVLSTMKEEGYAGGKVRLAHAVNPAIADSMASLIRANWPDADIAITDNRGLCSFYAEEGGLLVAYEI